MTFGIINQRIDFSTTLNVVKAALSVAQRNKTMVIPKNRIRLSRNLRAQVSPYPEAGRWLRRFVSFLIVVLIVGIYFFAKHNQTKTAPLPQNGQPKQILGEQEPPSPSEYVAYKIKRGDTLFNLSQKFEISWQTLAELNDLKAPYVLKIGQEIKIPKKETKP